MGVTRCGCSLYSFDRARLRLFCEFAPHFRTKSTADKEAIGGEANLAKVATTREAVRRYAVGAIAVPLLLSTVLAGDLDNVRPLVRTRGASPLEEGGKDARPAAASRLAVYDKVRRCSSGSSRVTVVVTGTGQLLILGRLRLMVFSSSFSF